MSKAALWGNRDIDANVRSEVRHAARRAGISVDEWVDGAIADLADQLGLHPDELDDRERRHAVMDRLEAGRNAEQRYSRRTDRQYASHALGEDEDFEDQPRRPRRSRARSAEVSYERDSYRDPESRRSPRGGLDRALSGESQAGVATMQRRLANIEAVLEETAAQGEDKSLRRALSRMEARLEALAVQAEERDEQTFSAPARRRGGHAPSREDRAAAASMQHELDEFESAVRRRSGSDDKALQRALARIEARLEAFATRQDAEADSLGHAAASTDRKHARSDETGSADEDFHARLEALEKSLRHGGNRTDADEPSPASAQARKRKHAPENATPAMGEIDRKLSAIAGMLAGRHQSAADVETDSEGWAGANDDGPVEQASRRQRGSGERPAVKMVVDNAQAAEKRDAPGSHGNGVRPSEMARIEAKLNLLLSREAGQAQLGGSFPPGATEAEARSPIAKAVAEITQRREALEGGRPGAQWAPARQDNSSPGQTAVNSVRNDLRSIAARLDELRNESAVRTVAQRRSADAVVRQHEPAAPAEPVAPPQQSLALDQLRSEIAAVSRAVSDLAPKTSVSSLEQSIRDLTRRVDSYRQDGVRESILQPLELLIGDLKQSFAQRSSLPQLGAIEHELQNIGKRIDRLGASGGQIDGGRLDEIHQQTSSIRDLLSKAIARPMPVDSIERQIDALGKRIDLIASRGPSPVGVAAVNENVDEIRASLQQAWPSHELAAIHERLEQVARKVDDAVANPPSLQRFDDISERIDAVQRTIFQRLERPSEETSETARKLESLMLEIRDRLDLAGRQEAPAGSDLIEAQLRTLGEKLDAARPADAEHLATLEGQLNSLSKKIESSVNPIGPAHIEALEANIRSLADKIDRASANPDAGALAALENQIRELAGRLDQPNVNMDLIANIEQTMSNLFDQIEDTRLAAADAAENAARHATREALDELISREALANSRAGDDTRDKLSQELTTLRSAQDATERRTHATLTAVHETLEKVVDRLAMLEDNIDSKPAAVATAAYSAGSMASGPAPLFQRKEPGPAPEAAEPSNGSFEQPQMRQATAPAAAPPVRRAGEFDNEFVEAPVAREPAPARPAAAKAPAIEREPSSSRAPEIQSPKSQAQALKLDPETAELWQDGEDDELLEPGTGSPAGRSNQPPRKPASKKAHAAPAFGEEEEEELVRGTQPGAKSASSFIAAARRASIAAQAEADANAATTDKKRPRGNSKENAFADARARAAAAAASLAGRLDRSGEGDAPAGKAAGKEAGKGSVLRNRKVLLTLGLAAAVIVLGTLQMLRSGAHSSRPPVAPAAVTTPAKPKAPPEAPAPGAAPVNAPAGAPAAPLTSPAPTGGQNGAALQNGFSKTSNSAPAMNRFVKPTDKTPVATIDATAKAGHPGTDLNVAAASGHAGAQYELAIRLIDGRSMPRDTKRGFDLMKKAADQGLPVAQYRLASMYEKGIGTEKDAKTALKLYEQAGNAGNVRAMHNYAVLAAEGAEGKPDYADAARWFQKAAEYGVRDSQYNLAILYARGLGISRNLIESYKWFDVAARQGDKDAATKRDQVAGRLAAGELAKAKQAATDFRPKVKREIANAVAAPPGGWTMSSSGSGPSLPTFVKPLNNGDNKKTRRPKVSAL